MVRTSSDLVSTWFQELPHHYKDWHPKDHIQLRVISGGNKLKKGSVVFAQERFGNRILSLRFIVIDVTEKIGKWKASFPLSFFNLHGSFAASEKGNQTKVTATVYYGWSVPILGAIMDWVVERFAIKKKAALKHMKEESLYMKKILEQQVR